MRFYLFPIILLLAACSKPVPPETVQTAPEAPQAITPAVVPPPSTVEGPTTQLEKQGAVRMVGVKHRHNAAERDAYAKAYANAKLANHLLGEHKYKESRKDKV